jgi:hypothetical protein
VGVTGDGGIGGHRAFRGVDHQRWRVPLTAENFDPLLLKLDVPDSASMKERLDSVSVHNLLGVNERATCLCWGPMQ